MLIDGGVGSKARDPARGASAPGLPGCLEADAACPGDQFRSTTPEAYASAPPGLGSADEVTRNG